MGKTKTRMTNRIIPESLTEPIHKGVGRGITLVGFGSWAGGIIAGSADGALGIIGGVSIAAVFATAGIAIIPHPNVIVDDWFAAEGVEEAEQRGDGF